MTLGCFLLVIDKETKAQRSSTLASGHTALECLVLVCHKSPNSLLLPVRLPVLLTGQRETEGSRSSLPEAQGKETQCQLRLQSPLHPGWNRPLSSSDSRPKRTNPKLSLTRPQGKSDPSGHRQCIKNTYKTLIKSVNH